MSESDNLPEVLAAIERVKQQILNQVDATAVEVSQRLEQKAKRIVSVDRDTQPYPAISGEPPMKVTGNLRRNIKGDVKRHGFGIYVAEVGSYMIYARALELGGAPTWVRGQKFPYLQPALEQFQKSNSIRRIFAKNIRKAL